MPVERSAGAVIFRNTSKGREYLLLHHHPSKFSKESQRIGGHWDFPKGYIEKGEKTEETARREVEEETGIKKIEIVPGFKETIRYFVNFKNEHRLKFVAFFLAKTSQKEVKISWEHQGYIWLPFQEAYKKLTYRNVKNLLKNADEFLKKSS